MAKVVICGPPASGKSTIVGHAVELLRARGEQLFGFVTTEIRRGSRRTGFTVTGVASGLERLLAVRGGPGPRIGTYGVDVDAFEEIALIELENGLELGGTIVVDEVGKMELLSPRFRELVDPVFASPRVLATFPAQPLPLTDALIRRPDVRVIGLPRSDRAELPAICANWVLDIDLPERAAV